MVAYHLYLYTYVNVPLPLSHSLSMPASFDLSALSRRVRSSVQIFFVRLPTHIFAHASTGARCFCAFPFVEKIAAGSRRTHALSTSAGRTCVSKIAASRSMEIMEKRCCFCALEKESNASTTTSSSSKELDACPDCGDVFYCGREHLALHKSDDGKTCFPIRLERTEARGRVVVANRWVEKTKIIIRLIWCHY